MLLLGFMSRDLHSRMQLLPFALQGCTLGYINQATVDLLMETASNVNKVFSVNSLFSFVASSLALSKRARESSKNLSFSSLLCSAMFVLIWIYVHVRAIRERDRFTDQKVYFTERFWYRFLKYIEFWNALNFEMLSILICTGFWNASNFEKHRTLKLSNFAKLLDSKSFV